MSLRRVAFVVNTFPKLSETFVMNELAELRRRGIEVLVLSLQPPTELLRHEIVAEAGLLERTVHGRAAFGDALRGFRPDLLHAHYATEPTAAACELALELGIPFTFTAHGYDITRRPPVDLAARASRAAAVVTVSRANARHLVEHFGVPAERIRVVPCGVDVDRFRPNGGPASPASIVCVARMSPVKNLGLLLDACAMLRKRGLEFRCALVGDGRVRVELEAARSSLRLEDTVDFVGPATQAQVLSFWQHASVAALTSHREGMPVSLMEAAACGVPAVATAVGGVAELVEDEVTGLLAPPGDARAFAAALERLLTQRDLAARLGAAARERVQERFSLAGEVDGLLALWDEVTA